MGDGHSLATPRFGGLQDPTFEVLRKGNPFTLGTGTLACRKGQWEVGILDYTAAPQRQWVVGVLGHYKRMCAMGLLQ